MSWIAVGVAVGAAVLKTEAVDQPKENRQRKLAAATQRYSPWTGLEAQPIQEADLGGNILQYGMTGAMMRQNMNDNAKANELADSEIAKNNATANTLPGKASTPMELQDPNAQAGGSLKPNRYNLGTWNYYSSI